uniref:Uncharacterized protein n=1 Tax=Asparagus officinalis TaxID=4686 RepID=Q2XNS3_ASPOF|nr:hypothetical protein 9.t00016 [Asparagus officinalis]
MECLPRMLASSLLSVDDPHVLIHWNDVFSSRFDVVENLRGNSDQMEVTHAISSVTTNTLAVSTEVGPSSHVEVPQSPDSDDLVVSKIQIMVESLTKLFNRSVETILAAGKGISPPILHMLWDQLDVLTLILREDDIARLVELNFSWLLVKCCEIKETTHKEVEQIKHRFQELIVHLATIDDKQTKLDNDILE